MHEWMTHMNGEPKVAQSSSLLLTTCMGAARVFRFPGFVWYSHDAQLGKHVSGIDVRCRLLLLPLVANLIMIKCLLSAMESQK